MRYIAFIHKDPDSIYGVSFPDMPGCISAGETIDEAVRCAVEALSGHVRMLEVDGDPVPQPRDFDAIMNDPGLAEEPRGRHDNRRSTGPRPRLDHAHQRVLRSRFLEAIDAAARERGQTRSAFLASAARREIVD